MLKTTKNTDRARTSWRCISGTVARPPLQQKSTGWVPAGQDRASKGIGGQLTPLGATLPPHPLPHTPPSPQPLFHKTPMQPSPSPPSASSPHLATHHTSAPPGHQALPSTPAAHTIPHRIFQLLTPTTLPYSRLFPTTHPACSPAHCPPQVFFQAAPSAKAFPSPHTHPPPPPLHHPPPTQAHTRALSVSSTALSQPHPPST